MPVKGELVQPASTYKITKILEPEEAHALVGWPKYPIETTSEYRRPLALRDDEGRVIWKQEGNTQEQNEALGIENVQGLFLDKFQEFDKLFPRKKNGAVIEKKREEAEGYILQSLNDKKGLAKGLAKVVGSSPLDQRIVSYFQGSTFIIIQKSFVSWGLRFEVFNRKVEEKSGVYIDNDNQWAPISFFVSESNQVSVSTLRSRFKRMNISNIQGVSGNSLSTLWNVKEATNYLSASTRIRRQTEYATETMLPLGAIAEALDISESVLQQYVEGVACASRIGKNGKETTFYNISELKRKMKDILSRPKIERKTGTWTNEDGVSFAPNYHFYTKYGIDQRTLKKYLKGVVSIPGRSREGKPIVLHNIEEAVRNMGDRASVLRVNRATGRIIDESGKKWINTKRITREYGFAQSSIQNCAKEHNLPSIIGVAHGRLVDFYPEDELLKALAISGRSVDPSDESGQTEDPVNLEMKLLLQQLNEYQAKLRAGERISFEEFLRQSEVAQEGGSLHE